MKDKLWHEVYESVVTNWSEFPAEQKSEKSMLIFLFILLGDHADDVNILGRSVYTIKKNTETLVIANKEIGLEVNADKTKYIVMSRDQNAGRRHSIKTDNSCFERVEQFRYLGTTFFFLSLSRRHNPLWV